MLNCLRIAQRPVCVVPWSRCAEAEEGRGAQRLRRRIVPRSRGEGGEGEGLHTQRQHSSDGVESARAIRRSGSSRRAPQIASSTAATSAASRRRPIPFAPPSAPCRAGRCIRWATTIRFHHRSPLFAHIAHHCSRASKNRCGGIDRDGRARNEECNATNRNVNYADGLESGLRANRANRHRERTDSFRKRSRLTVSALDLSQAATKVESRTNRTRTTKRVHN